MNALLPLIWYQFTINITHCCLVAGVLEKLHRVIIVKQEIMIVGRNIMILSDISVTTCCVGLWVTVINPYRAKALEQKGLIFMSVYIRAFQFLIRCWNLPQIVSNCICNVTFVSTVVVVLVLVCPVRVYGANDAGIGCKQIQSTRPVWLFYQRPPQIVRWCGERADPFLGLWQVIYLLLLLLLHAGTAISESKRVACDWLSLLRKKRDFPDNKLFGDQATRPSQHLLGELYYRIDRCLKNRWYCFISYFMYSCVCCWWQAVGRFCVFFCWLIDNWTVGHPVMIKILNFNRN